MNAKPKTELNRCVFVQNRTSVNGASAYKIFVSFTTNIIDISLNFEPIESAVWFDIGETIDSPYPSSVLEPIRHPQSHPPVQAKKYVSSLLISCCFGH